MKTQEEFLLFKKELSHGCPQGKSFWYIYNSRLGFNGSIDWGIESDFNTAVTKGMESLNKNNVNHIVVQFKSEEGILTIFEGKKNNLSKM